ncbi:hypothetical protein D3C76_1179980 [compost metagenome]
MREALECFLKEVWLSLLLDIKVKLISVRYVLLPERFLKTRQRDIVKSCIGIEGPRLKGAKCAGANSLREIMASS